MSRRCFLASAAYGSDLAAPVQFLRYYRDSHLKPSYAGRAVLRGFESVYYSFAPFFARRIDPSQTLRRLTRIFVADPFVNMIILVLFVSSKRFRLSLSAKDETSFCRGMARIIIGGIGGHVFGWSWLLWNASLILALLHAAAWWNIAVVCWGTMGIGLLMVRLTDALQTDRLLESLKS